MHVYSTCNGLQLARGSQANHFTIHIPASARHEPQVEALSFPAQSLDYFLVLFSSFYPTSSILLELLEFCQGGGGEEEEEDEAEAKEEETKTFLLHGRISLSDLYYEKPYFLRMEHFQW